jgi:hypothetical protein
LLVGSGEISGSVERLSCPAPAAASVDSLVGSDGTGESVERLSGSAPAAAVDSLVIVLSRIVGAVVVSMDASVPMFSRPVGKAVVDSAAGAEALLRFVNASVSIVASELPFVTGDASIA